MAMGRSEGVQDDLMATWAEMPRSPGHDAFYDRLQELLREAGFDAFVERVCNPYYPPRMGAQSYIAPALTGGLGLEAQAQRGPKHPLSRLLWRHNIS